MCFGWTNKGPDTINMLGATMKIIELKFVCVSVSKTFVHQIGQTADRNCWNSACPDQKLWIWQCVSCVFIK